MHFTVELLLLLQCGKPSGGLGELQVLHARREVSHLVLVFPFVCCFFANLFLLYSFPLRTSALLYKKALSASVLCTVLGLSCVPYLGLSPLSVTPGLKFFFSFKDHSPILAFVYFYLMKISFRDFC